jgi:organic radical activating enzyme
MFEIFNINDYKKTSKAIVIYGAGALGKIVYEELKRREIKKIVFCDLVKAGDIIDENKVLHPAELSEKADEIVVLLTLMGNSFFDVAKIVTTLQISCYTVMNILDDIDFISIDNQIKRTQTIKLRYQYANTLKRYYMYTNIVENRELINQQDITVSNAKSIKDFHKMTLVVTDRCTLRCKDCGALVPFYKNPKDIAYGAVLSSFKRFLNCVDYLESIVIVGGETLLYKDLIPLIEFCAKEPKIISISIPTNATIMPTADLLQCLFKNNVKIIISDYPLERCYALELEKLLLENGIEVERRQMDKWNYLGDFTKKNYTEQQLKNVFMTCESRECWDMKAGKIAPCGVYLQAREVATVPDFIEDYVDFANETIGNDVLKKQFGILLNKSSMEACRYCNGSRVKIKPAEQVRD